MAKIVVFSAFTSLLIIFIFSLLVFESFYRFYFSNGGLNVSVSIISKLCLLKYMISLHLFYYHTDKLKL